MNDFALMCVMQRVGNLLAQFNHLLRWSGNLFGQRFAFDIFHYQKVQPLILNNVVQQHNVGVI